MRDIDLTVQLKVPQDIIMVLTHMILFLALSSLSFSMLLRLHPYGFNKVDPGTVLKVLDNPTLQAEGLAHSAVCNLV